MVHCTLYWQYLIRLNVFQVYSFDSAPSPFLHFFWLYSFCCHLYLFFNIFPFFKNIERFQHSLLPRLESVCKNNTRFLHSPSFQDSTFCFLAYCMPLVPLCGSKVAPSIRMVSNSCTIVFNMYMRCSPCSVGEYRASTFYWQCIDNRFPILIGYSFARYNKVQYDLLLQFWCTLLPAYWRGWHSYKFEIWLMHRRVVLFSNFPSWYSHVYIRTSPSFWWPESVQ